MIELIKTSWDSMAYNSLFKLRCVCLQRYAIMKLIRLLHVGLHSMIRHLDTKFGNKCYDMNLRKNIFMITMQQ